MKRLFAIFVSMALALSCGAPALAVEDPNVDYAAIQVQIDEIQDQIDELLGKLAPLAQTMNDRYDDYYEKYGDMEDWDEATWTLSNSWDEYQWEGYSQAQENSFGDDWDYLTQMKTEMGMHFSKGLNLQVQGEYLDVQPVAQDGVTYYPADKLLTALGAKSTKVEKVDVNGVSCLPIRPVAEENGYEVDWNGDYELVTLTNWDALTEELDAEFTVFNTILAASMNTVDANKTYESKAKLDYILTLYGEEKDDTAKLSLDMNALMAGDYSAMSMDYTLGTDLGDVADLIKDMGGQTLLDEAKALNGAKYSMLLDGAQGGLYFKGSNLSKANEFLPDDKWVGMTDDAFGVAYIQLMAQMKDLTVGKLLVLMAKDSYDPHGMLNEIKPMFSLLFADDAFTTTKSGTVTTYTTKMDMVKLAARAAKLGLFTLEDLTDALGEIKLPVVNYQFTAKVAGEKLTSVTMKGKLTWSAITVEMDINSTDTTSDVYMAVKGRYLGKLECKGTTTMKPTGKTVPAAPAEFADYVALMQEYYQSLWGEWDDPETEGIEMPLDPEMKPMVPKPPVVIIPDEG